MVIASSTNLFILFWQASHLLWGCFMKRNLANRGFHLVKNGNLTKTVYISSKYTSLGRNLSKIAFFQGGWSVIWEKKCTAPFLKFIM